MKAKDLRNSILQLAMQGKLVPQDNNEISAEVLLEQIKEEKRKIGKGKKTNYLKLSHEIAEDEIPYDIPESWKWARLSEVSIDIYTGNSISKSVKDSKYTGLERGRPYIGTKDLNFDGSFDYNNGISIPYDENNFKIAPSNAILCCIEGGSAGRKIGKTEREVCFGNKLACTIPLIILPDYILYYFTSETFKTLFTGLLTGIIGGVGINKFRELVVPVPPLEEQNRIVNKLKQCMDLINKYQNIEEELFQLEMEFPDKLIKSLLQQAIQGKLVEQKDSDEPVVELFEKINNRKKKNLLIKREEKPFEIPENWEWVKLGGLLDGRTITYGIIKLGKETNIGNRVLRCSDIKFRRIDDSKIRLVDWEISNQYKRTELLGGEILINVRGTLGGCAIATEEYIGSNIAREVAMIPISKEINNKYILNVLSSPYIQNKVSANLRGIAYKGLNINLLENFEIPLPPINEQERIVKKLDELLRLCEILSDEDLLMKRNTKRQIGNAIELVVKKDNNQEIAIAARGDVGKSDLDIAKEIFEEL